MELTIEHAERVLGWLKGELAKARGTIREHGLDEIAKRPDLA